MKNTGIISQMKDIKKMKLNEELLNESCQSEGFKIMILDSIESTNTYLKAQVNKLDHKTVLCAEEQRVGKGRQDRSFVSNKYKGLYCSFVWKMKFESIQVQWFSLMTAVAIVKAIKETINCDIKIKWPNDLIIDQKKCAGILIESEISADQKDISLVCGFGINVYQQDFPEDIKHKVISLEDVCEKEIDRNQLLINILKSLDTYLRKPYDEQSLSLYHQYLYLPKENVHIQHHEQRFQAKLMGINEEGYMRCIKENGELLSLSVEEIHIL